MPRVQNKATLHQQILQHLQTLNVPLTSEQVDELLATAAQHERPQLDEQLYLEVFGAPAPAARKRA